MKKMKMHPNHALEIRDVCEEDSGLYSVVLKNSAAALEQRLNITLVVNGNQFDNPFSSFGDYTAECSLNTARDRTRKDRHILMPSNIFKYNLF